MQLFLTPAALRLASSVPSLAFRAGPELALLTHVRRPVAL